MRGRVVLLTRPTAREEIALRYGTVGQARFAMRSPGGLADFDRLERQDERFSEAEARIAAALPDGLKLARLDRALLPQFLFEPADLVIALGQDGLVANAGKYLDGQPLVGVNPDPERIEGALLPFTVETCIHFLPALLADRMAARPATLAEARTDDGQVIRGLNEIFVGVPSHQSARYRIRHGGSDELQSSSGVIAATGTGSTGWLRSIAGVEAAFDPGAESLAFRVREAWPGRGFGASIITGRCTAAEPLVIESRMEEGVIFADGIEADGIRFDAGREAVILPSSRRVSLVQPAVG